MAAGLSRDQLASRFYETLTDKNRKRAKAVIESGKMKGVWKPELASTTGPPVNVITDSLATSVFEHPDPAIRYFNRISAGGLLVLAWENTKAEHTQDPQWEFLRHCRNAAAHRGHFHFYPGEPKRLAKWRQLEIHRRLDGEPIFPDPPRSGFIGISDVLYLLADIEKQFY